MWIRGILFSRCSLGDEQFKMYPHHPVQFTWRETRESNTINLQLHIHVHLYSTIFIKVIFQSLGYQANRVMVYKTWEYQPYISLIDTDHNHVSERLSSISTPYGSQTTFPSTHLPTFTPHRIKMLPTVAIDERSTLILPHLTLFTPRILLHASTFTAISSMVLKRFYFKSWGFFEGQIQLRCWVDSDRGFEEQHWKMSFFERCGRRMNNWEKMNGFDHFKTGICLHSSISLL